MPNRPGLPTLFQRIARAQPTLTSAQQRIAAFVLDQPLRVATLPINEMAAQAGVSVATANRFARMLQFDGYAQFRAALVRDFGEALAPVERLRHSLQTHGTTQQVFEAVMSGVERNLQATRRGLDPTSCERAVELILKARRIYIVGYGSSSWLGGLMQRNLERCCENVQLLSSLEGSSYAARLISRITPADLLIAMSFPRYYTDTVLLTQRAQATGAPILGLTDRPTSPLAPLSTTVLYAQTDSAYFANSEATVATVIEALTSAVQQAAKGSLGSAAQLAQLLEPWLYDAQVPGLREAVPQPTPRRTRPRRPRAAESAPQEAAQDHAPEDR